MASARGAEPGALLVVSYEGEEHTDAVLALLAARGVPVHRIDLGHVPARLGLELHWDGGRAPRWLLHPAAGAGPVIDLASVRAVWWRRVRPFEIDPAIGTPERRQFAHSETSQATLGLLDALGALGVPWVNARLADEAAHHKPLQWSVAQALGLRVPRTLVTTEAAVARAFVAELGLGNVVFKAFLASIEEWRETRLVEAGDLQRLELLKLAPVIFQHYIRGVDLRVTVIGEQVFAAEIDARHTSYPVDMRMVIGEGTVRPVRLPRALERKLLALQRRLGLVYGAIDLKRDEAGEYHFLEVNPAGQWMFVEQRTGLPISQAHAQLLERLVAAPAPRS